MPVVLAIIILLPLVLGPLAALFCGSRRRTACAATLAVITAASVVALATQAPAVMAGKAVVAFWPWVPEIGLNIALRLDGLALLFCGLILFVGLLVILYAHYYLGEDDPPGRFYGLLAIFMASMLGIVLADNLLLLAVFWEATSLASFLLIGYWGHREPARQGARMSLTITAGGGGARLAGLLRHGQIGGTVEI
jgi:multicomponent K+:H+ antiporter subunit A